MKAGSALVPQSGLLDEARLSIGVPVWLAGLERAGHWCPVLARWMKGKPAERQCPGEACWVNIGYALVP